MARQKRISLLSSILGGLVAAAVVLIAHPFAVTIRHKVLVRSSGATTYASDLSSATLSPSQIYSHDAHGVVAIRAAS